MTAAESRMEVGPVRDSIFLREERADKLWSRVWLGSVIAAGIFFVALYTLAVIAVTHAYVEHELKREIQAKAEAPKAGFSCKQALEAFRICADPFPRKK